MTYRGPAYFQDFTLDDGREVECEWTWDIDHPCVWSITVKETCVDVPELNPAESERFDEIIFNLDPFPPHEVHYWGDE